MMKHICKEKEKHIPEDDQFFVVVVKGHWRLRQLRPATRSHWQHLLDVKERRCSDRIVVACVSYVEVDDEHDDAAEHDDSRLKA
jgi:hypothetical protein